MSPSISVIVPTLNRLDDLLVFVNSLKKQTVKPQELVIVDAGTIEHLQETLQQTLTGSGIALQYAKSEAGTSLQRNVAMEMAKGDIFFFFDDDIILEPDYIEQTLPCFDLQHDPPVGAVLGTFNSPYTMGKWKQKYAQLFRMTHTADTDSPKVMSSGAVCWSIEPSKVIQIPVCSGGRVAFRRECFEDHKWDTFLPGYTMSEDVEISYRIAKKWTFVQNPKAKLYHKKSPVSRDKYGERVARLIYSRYYFFQKNLPKTPRHVAGFAWWNVGVLLLYSNVAVFKTKRQPIDTLKGLKKGYSLCFKHIMKL